MFPERISPLALALEGCQHCAGHGEVTLYGRPTYPASKSARLALIRARLRSRQTAAAPTGTRICDCVYRRVFRACYDRYGELRQQEGNCAQRTILERASRREGKCGLSAGFKAVEYLADFEMVARRVLASSPLEHAVFRCHCLQGLDWKACLPLISRHLGQPLNRGTFFHAVYRMEQILGRAFLELQPYSLFPREYFSGWYVQQAALHSKSVMEGFMRLGEASHLEIRRDPEAGFFQPLPEATDC